MQINAAIIDKSIFQFISANIAHIDKYDVQAHVFRVKVHYETISELTTCVVNEDILKCQHDRKWDFSLPILQVT